MHSLFNSSSQERPCQYLYLPEWRVDRAGQGGVVRVEIFHYTHNNNNTEDHYSHIDTTLNLPIQLWGGGAAHIVRPHSL